MQNQLENRVYAGFWVRLIAFAIDSLLAALVVSTIKSPFAIASEAGIELFDANFLFHYSFLDVLDYVAVVAYFVLLTYYSHTTPGKMAMGLEVITVDKEWTLLNVIYRETIGRFFSSLMCAGYFAVIVTRKKQGFHDMLCDTYVVYKNMVPKKAMTPVANVQMNEPKPMVEANMDAIHNVEMVSPVMPEDMIAEPLVSTQEMQEEQPKTTAPVYYSVPEKEVTNSQDAMNQDSSDLSNSASEETE
ncbi:MAG: RDD family protein [Lachnospiraceae bacterium]|nr:RDD family protein [Lachnospiraceae bacterium]